MSRNIWFTSDHHFWHRNIIKFSNRPFDDIYHMNEILIQNWNNVVKPEDKVYHLGDIALCSKNYVYQILDRLNGSVCLVKGNHDKINSSFTGFEWIKDYYELTINKKTKLVLMHFPIESWNKKHHGSIHLHGHTHDTNKITGLRRVHIGVDAHSYTPVHVDAVIDMAQNPDKYEHQKCGVHSVKIYDRH